jgi:hypothetical protein
MINEISSSDVEILVRDEDRTEIREDSQENPNPNSSQTNIQNKKKGLLREVVELSASSLVGAGMGYMFGGVIRAFVDLSKQGIVEIQKRSEEENAQRYLGINEYTICGISFGSMVGVFSYLLVAEIIKQRNEREAELKQIRDNIAGEDNFNGALSVRQEVAIPNGIGNGDDRGRVIDAELTVNGDTRHDLGNNPRNMMVVGEGNLNNVNAVSIFQSRQSREGSVENFSSTDELNLNEFEKLIDEAVKNSKMLESEESQRKKAHDEELPLREVLQKSVSDEDKKKQIENAEKFLKSNGYDDFSKNSPNLVFVLRPGDSSKQIAEISRAEDDGSGVRPRLDDDSNISAFNSALESLKSPRNSLRSSQAMETRGDLDELKRTKPYFQAIQVFKEKILTTETQAPSK